MGDIEFEFEFTIGSDPAEWQGVAPPGSASSWSFAFGDASGADRAGCSAGACPLPAAHPAEAEWEQLASAVPVPGQLHRFKPRCEGMAYPTEEDFRSAVAAVRPSESDDHALQHLREVWDEGVAGRLAEWSKRLRSGLSALAEGWAGDDFEAFTAQVEAARSLVEGVVDDVGGTTAELRLREEAIYTLQGGDSGEIPYPAPMVGVEGEWSELVALHVRPAWWHGDCILMGCEEAEQAMKIAGADAELAAQVREFIEEKVGEGFSGLGAVVSDVRHLAGEEAREQFGPRVEAELTAYVERQAAIDEAIAEKRSGQSAELEAFAPAGEDRPYPTTADHTHMDLQVPQMERPAAPTSPETRQDPSLTPPGGDGSVGDAAEEDVEDDLDEVWEESEVDDAEVSGGLSGTAPGGVTGGGVPGAVPGGSATAAPGSYAAAAGAVPATVPGAAGGGARTAAAAGGSHGAAPPKGRQSDPERDEEPKGKDLTNRETGNVWGYVNPRNDPYA